MRKISIAFGAVVVAGVLVFGAAAARPSRETVYDRS